MKICWDNLENSSLTKNGFIRINNMPFMEVESCLNCSCAFLAHSASSKLFCSRSCASSYNINKKKELFVGSVFGDWTIIKKTTQRLHGCVAYLCRCVCGKERLVDSGSLRRGSSKSCGCRTTRRNMGGGINEIGNRYGSLVVVCKGNEINDRGILWQCVCDCGNEIEVLGVYLRYGAVISCGCTKYKLGAIKESLVKFGVASYDTYKDSFGRCEEVDFKIIDNSNGFKQLLVRCAYCNKLYGPTQNQVHSRLSSLNGAPGENRFYCSEGCKKACPIFNQIKFPKGYKKASSREVQPELRQMVLERDNWTCQYGSCRKTTEDDELHCHHIEGIHHNPVESADIDMCITLCKVHHKYVHKQTGCTYNDMKCITEGV